MPLFELPPHCTLSHQAVPRVREPNYAIPNTPDVTSIHLLLGPHSLICRKRVHRAECEAAIAPRDVLNSYYFAV